MPKKNLSSHKDLAPIPVRGWIFFVWVICLHLPTWALYVSTIVLLVLVPTYVHANMLATHKNDTTLTGKKMEQERQMSPNVGPTFSNMSPTCRPTRQCRIKIANADIRQTQLSSSDLPKRSQGMPNTSTWCMNTCPASRNEGGGNARCDKHSGDHQLGWNGRWRRGCYKTSLGQAAVVCTTLHQR